MTTEMSDDDWVRLHLAQMREEGELELPFEPRCRVCRNPDVCKTVNGLLSRGFTLSAILASLQPVNAALPPKARVSRDSLYKHARLHFNMQAPAGAIWRRIQEQRATESGADFESGIASLVTAAGYFDVMLHRGFEMLVAEDTVVSVDQGAYAAKQLHELTRQEAGVEQIARQQAEMNRIVKVMRDVVPERYHQAILDVLDGKEANQMKEIEDVDDLEEFDPAADEGFEEED